jgi:hypothetical protein
MSDIVKRLEPTLIDMYLPEHIRAHMKMLGRTRDETEAKVKEVMGDPEKKAEYMKLVETMAEEEQGK